MAGTGKDGNGGGKRDLGAGGDGGGVRKSWTHWASLLAMLLALWLLRDLMLQQGAVATIPYSEFHALLKDGKIAEVTVSERLVNGKLKVADAQGKTSVVAVRVEPAIAEELDKYGVPYSRALESDWFSQLLSWIAPTAIFIGFWYWMNKRLLSGKGAGGGGMGGLLGIGQSHAKTYVEQSTGVRFEDVAGVDEAKAELQEIVDFLKNPKEHGRLGARIPKGVLLMGPTGTGKTLLARAVAGEAGVPFFSISGSEFIEMFVGVGAARVRDLFEQARAKAPAIIFIDELDALGKTRGASSLIGGHDEREQTLNQLLVELDGFDPRVGVVLLAATNRPETLDPALLRAGRFDRQVLVDRPDRKGRLDILKVHVKKIRVAAGVDLDQVAAITVGFAGADLANLVNEAALVATRRKAEAVNLDDFTAALERIVAGIEKKHRILSADEKKLVAYHELGHALTALALPGSDEVHKVSIVPHGIGALGYTLQRPSEDRHVLKRSELLVKMSVLLGGRAAEHLVFGEPSTGAADDLARATDMARDMVQRYGMDKKLGPVAYAERAPAFLVNDGAASLRSEYTSPETAERIDEAVRQLLQEALQRSRDVLHDNREILDRAAEALMAQETLDEPELRKLAEGLKRVGRVE